MTRSPSVFVVGASAALAGVLYLVKKKISRAKDLKDNDDPSVMYTRLTEFEDLMFSRGAAPISTVTWFSGNHLQAGSIIEQRLHQIVKANPWLAGRIVKRDGKNYLCYSSLNTPLQKLFHHLSPGECPISRDTAFEDLGKTCAASSLVFEFYHDPKQPLWKASLVPCCKSPSTHFCVIITMAHGLGDGHTYYKLYNMLMGADQVHALLPIRIINTARQQEEAMGKDEYGVMWNAGYIISAVRGILVAKLFAPLLGKRLQVSTRYILVDTDKLQQIKKQAVRENDDVSFVSSNDVLSSWFFSNCACQHGLMAINFRKRLEGHADELAGNYENLLYYSMPDDTSNPTLIRKSLPTMKRAVTANFWPSWWTMARQDFGMISNWASFIADTCNLEGCQEQVHLPLYGDICSILPSSIAMCIIFRAGPNRQLAVLVAGTPDKLEGLLDAPFEAQGQQFK